MLNKFSLMAVFMFASFEMICAQSKDALCPELYPYPANLFSHDMNHLPKVQVNVRNNGKLKGYILLTTHRSSENPYFSSVQLIDLENPTLPVWFGCINESSQFLITDGKLLPNGYLSFFLKSDTLQFPLPEVLGEGAKGIVEGYFELDNTLKPIEFMTMAGINHHDYKKFPNGDRLVLVGDGKELNLSKYKFKGQ